MKRYLNPKLMMLVLTLTLSLLAVAFGRLPKVGAVVVPNPTCTMNPVVTNDANSGAGSLRQAVSDACAGSTITFANNVTGPIFLQDGQITIDKNLTIQGPGANALTVQNTAGRSPTSRVFLVNSGVTATIAGLTITGGNIYLANHGDNGGGIYNQGSLTITDSIVKNNQADSPGEAEGLEFPFGGGIANADFATLTVTNSNISHNSVFGSGGGIFNSLGTVNINNSTIEENNAYGEGGGIYSVGAFTVGKVTVTNSTISNNSAAILGYGGAGIYNSSGTIILTNSTVSGNFSTATVSPNGGGGIYNSIGTVTLTNTTITNNRVRSNCFGFLPCVKGQGGGIFSTGTVNSRNSIIAGNAGVFSDFFGSLNSQGYNLIGNMVFPITGDTTGNIVGTNVAPVDARLAPLGFNGGQSMTHALLSNSPAVDAGNTATSPAADQRGAGRVGTADIGAFEVNNPTNGGNYVATLPDGVTGITYSYMLIPNMGAWTYSMTGGALPSGISLSTNGAIVSIGGTTNQSGVFNFTVTGTDGVNSIVTDYRLQIIAATPTPTITATPVTSNTGSAFANFQIATVNDAQDAENNLTVTINGDTSATVTGVTVNAISVSAAGIVTADVMAACGATTANFTLRVTDSGGLFNDATLMVTVNPDNQPPTIICPANIMKSADIGVCMAIVTYTTPTATDNCTGAGAVTCTPSSGSVFSKGTTMVTCTATDAGGNPASCSFTVSVADAQSPTLSACPANQNVSTASGCVTVTYTPPTVSDNCSGATVACVPPSGSCFAVGTTTVTCTGTDTSSNTTICSFTVTVSLCTITCPANVTAPTTSGHCQAVINYNAPTTTGSCATVACTPPSGSTFPKGTTTVTCSTQTGPTCSFTVSVADTQSPTLSACPANQNVAITSGCTNVTYTPPAVSDNCSGATVACVPPSGSCFAVGTTTVTCTGTDTSNNTAMCSFTVTATPCTITCPANVTAPASNGLCTAVVNYNAPTTTGSCGTVTCSPASGSTFPKGITTVICSTQTGPSCSFTVTVNDTQAPQLTCPANVTQATAKGLCEAVVSYANATATDNCSAVGTPTCTPANGSVFAKGVTTVTCTVSDASSNTGSGNFTVTITDNEAPTLACPTNISVPTTAGQCAAVVSYATPQVSDNCPNVGAVICSPASGTSFARGVTTVTCTVADASGNTRSCSFSVTINDTTPPQLACPANIIKPTDAGQCAAIVSYTPTASDNCSGVIVTCTPPSGSSFPKGTTSVSCVATDASKNAVSCSFSVTVSDNQAPQLTCPANQTRVAATPGTATVIVMYAAPAISDNCPGATVVCVPPSGSSFPLGTTTVTCTASDAAGNTTSCTFTVTIYDIGLQDDTNPAVVVLVNSSTGQYRFCYSSTVLTGTGTVSRQGSTYMLSHNVADRRVSIRVNGGGSPPSGTALLQSLSGASSCTITDRDIRNNSCQCP